MRIISGKARGRRLTVPSEQGARPFLEQARAAIFNIIHKKINTASVLDIYAGSGALGIEALSRGAENACFIERDRTSIRMLEENIAKCGFTPQSRIICDNAENAIESINSHFDFIFLDPPFADTENWENNKVAEKIMKNTVKILAENGTIIFRLEKAVEYPEMWHSLQLADERTYGRSRICFYNK